MLNIYLSGEIHTDWREEIINLCKNENLNISFSSPITNHEASDNCGVEILGQEEKNFWKDSKGANINSIKTRKAIKDADIVVSHAGQYTSNKNFRYLLMHIKSIIRINIKKLFKIF